MLIATCALDEREVGLWRLCTKGRFTLKKYDVEPADADVTSLSFSHDGTVLDLGSGIWHDEAMESSVSVQLWSLTMQHFQFKLEGDAGSGCAQAVAFSPVSERLVAVAESGKCFVWNLLSRECLQFFAAHTVSCKAFVHRFFVLFSPGGALLATCSRDTKDGLRLWCSKTWNLLGALGDRPVAAALLYHRSQAATC